MGEFPFSLQPLPLLPRHCSHLAHPGRGVLRAEASLHHQCVPARPPPPPEGPRLCGPTAPAPALAGAAQGCRQRMPYNEGELLSSRAKAHRGPSTPPLHPRLQLPPSIKSWGEPWGQTWRTNDPNERAPPPPPPLPPPPTPPAAVHTQYKIAGSRLPNGGTPILILGRGSPLENGNVSERHDLGRGCIFAWLAHHTLAPGHPSATHLLVLAPRLLRRPRFGVATQPAPTAGGALPRLCTPPRVLTLTAALPRPCPAPCVAAVQHCPAQLQSR